MALCTVALVVTMTLSLSVPCMRGYILIGGENGYTLLIGSRVVLDSLIDSRAQIA